MSNPYAPTTVATEWQHMQSGLGHEHFYVSLLGLRTFDVAGLRARVEEGLSYHALKRLWETVDLPATDFCELVSISPRTLARRKEAGRLRPDESDRLLRLTRVVGLALRLFEGDLDNARRWLMTPQVALGGTAPLAYATTDIGVREVENLIGRIEHGIPI